MENSLIKKVLLLVVIYFFFTVYSKITTSICIIRGFIGIPCPACGIIRAYVSLIKRHPLKALYYHPLYILPIIILWFYKFNKDNFHKCLNTCIILGIVVYFIRIYYMFPYKEPMELNHNAILFKIIELMTRSS
ncbi:DUF2752 domain-containing protein [Clostridium botulinum]|uniref:DUF2752 domain-containing protein n=1 Tax=Clostridium botulinum TaxID=1491 RepID=UPI0009B2BDD7|nr:DUF2752 domain-containing protein [Clostridium botulinum]MCD3349444.1 DUF2752 domain-containing protein [Clostridium botulinum D/C]MCD3358565.1 DUF2752 domain-containing protein [Clostridium botulinum D/C]MCD3363557.1 DUF2752 domain-containing protein [Clostridium botulinum D/C]MCD3364370.1 DUF2752 domain-containing protein [Clostridium botulinum D/C]QPW61491.1 DUF2752 domain-containing protein [Clostridium botulinum]